MKKRISTFLLALLAALTLTVPAWAETQPGDALIYDTESLLTDGERQQLESLADQITWQYDCAVYVVTIYDYEQYADGVYEAACTIYNDYDFGIGEDRDGVLLLLSMYDRSYSLYVRDGYAQSMIGSYAQQQLEDSFLDYLGDDDWYGGFHAYLTTCADMMQQASEGHAVRKPLGKVIFPALLVGCGDKTNNDANTGDDNANGGTVAETVSGTVSTDGSTSMEKVIGALSESYMAANKDVTVNYNPTGSGSGITAVQEGTCDIGLSSRALKDEEKAGGLKETVLAYDGIAMIVNPANPVSDLTLEQIAAIYKGEITNWKDVGGNDAQIVLIGREAGSGTRDGFESITDTKDACQYRQELTSTGDVIATVAQNPDAIGYASLAALKDTVKALNVNGVAPTEATVKDGSYKIQRPFVLVTKADTSLSAAAQNFFDYATSSDASGIISAAGAVAAN